MRLTRRLALTVCAMSLLLPSAGFAAEQAWSESGQASWYGPRHEGLRTTSGERFDSRKLTAAHASLPLGTLVKVTLQSSGTSVIVRVNDREPAHGVRCIDLSRAAAARLGIVSRGVGDVTLAAVSPAEAIEVAEAPEASDATPSASHRPTAPHGRPHRHHARR